MTSLKWLTFLLGSLTATLSPALLDLFISSDTSICSKIAFLLLGNSDHVAVLVSINFPSNSKRDVLFHHIAYGYSHTDWGGVCDHLRDVPWEDIFKLGASVNFVSGFRLELMDASLISLIISLFFHLEITFNLYQQNKSSESTVKFRQARNCCQRVLEAAEFSYVNKTKEPFTSDELGSKDFWQIAISVLNKLKSAIPPLFCVW